jgi:hypothetical protein
MEKKYIAAAMLAALSPVAAGEASARDPMAVTRNADEDAPRQCFQPSDSQSLDDIVGVIRGCANNLEQTEVLRTQRRSLLSLASSGAGLLALAGGTGFSPGTTDALSALAIIPIFADDRFNSSAVGRIDSATAGQMNTIASQIDESDQRTAMLMHHEAEIGEASRALYEQITAARTHLIAARAAPVRDAPAALESRANRLAAINAAIAAASQVAGASEEVRAQLAARRTRFETMSGSAAVRYYDEAHAARVRALSAIEPSPAQSLTSIVAAPFMSVTSVFRTRGTLAQDAFATPAAVDVTAIRSELPDLEVEEIDINVPSYAIDYANLAEDDFDVIDRMSVQARAVIAQMRAAETNAE